MDPTPDNAKDTPPNMPHSAGPIDTPLHPSPIPPSTPLKSMPTPTTPARTPAPPLLSPLWAARSTLAVPDMELNQLVKSTEKLNIYVEKTSTPDPEEVDKGLCKPLDQSPISSPSVNEELGDVLEKEKAPGSNKITDLPKAVDPKGSSPDAVCSNSGVPSASLDTTSATSAASPVVGSSNVDNSKASQSGESNVSVDAASSTDPSTVSEGSSDITMGSSVYVPENELIFVTPIIKEAPKVDSQPSVMVFTTITVESTTKGPIENASPADSQPPITMSPSAATESTTNDTIKEALPSASQTLGMKNPPVVESLPKTPVKEAPSAASQTLAMKNPPVAESSPKTPIKEAPPAASQPLVMTNPPPVVESPPPVSKSSPRTPIKEAPSAASQSLIMTTPPPMAEGSHKPQAILLTPTPATPNPSGNPTGLSPASHDTSGRASPSPRSCRANVFQARVAITENLKINISRLRSQQAILKGMGDQTKGECVYREIARIEAEIERLRKEEGGLV